MGPDDLRHQVIAANVTFYKGVTTGHYDYDDYECCVTDPGIQAMLEQDLDAMASALSGSFKKIRCLDCGGGSGNLTLKMLQRGWDVTVVDVSPDMLAVAQSKLGAAGYQPRLVNDSIENFLSTTSNSFEVVTFSSVLHHLYEPTEVIRHIAPRIAPGGFFYSNFDRPRPRNRLLTKSLLDLDTVCAKLVSDRKDLLSGIARRTRKLFLRKDPAHHRPVLTAGDLAEYHAKTGLDQRLIVATLQELGFEVYCEHYNVARTALVRQLNRVVPALQNFKIRAQRKRAA